MQKELNQGHRHFQNNTLLYPPQQTPMIFAPQQGIGPRGQRPPVLANPTGTYFVTPQQAYIPTNIYHQQAGPNDVYQGYPQATTFIQNGQQYHQFQSQPSYPQYAVMPGYTMQQQQQQQQTQRMGSAPQQMTPTRFSHPIPAAVQPQPFIHNQVNAEPAPLPVQTQKKTRTKITIVDPNTGEDKTDEFTKKPEKPATIAPVVVAAAPPEETIKASVNAQFQAQVLAVAAKAASSQATKPAIITEPFKPDNKETDLTTTEKETPTQTKTVTPKTDVIKKEEEQTSKPQEDKVNKQIEQVVSKKTEPEKQEINIVTDTDKSKDTHLSEKTATSPAVALPVIDTPKSDTTTEAIQPESVVVPVQEIVTETLPDTSEEIIPVVSNDVETVPAIPDAASLQQDEPLSVAPTTESVAEVPEEKADVDVPMPDTDISSIQEDANKSAFNTVTKKKKGKNRFKDIDSKDNGNNDMLSAFKDKPEKKEKEIETKTIDLSQENDIPSEDATWEDKEKSIEKEVIRNEDAEETEVIPKTAETRIITSESTPVPTEEDKLQYDRDFLLKFQFAPICKTKPANLPNIDIVLEKAHAPTEALIPGQKIASNDFMPTFMRSQSGGGSRSSGGGRSSGSNRRIGSSSLSTKPQKVIQVPQFEKIELKKSDNAWVRPSEKVKELSEEEKELDELSRSVRSILNKLTPQKYDTLVSQMKSLKIDSAGKLQQAIDLVFEKAVSEPAFSVAYAKMCRELSESSHLANLPPEVTTKGEQGQKSQPQGVSFRKVLLNKCQKEFEKEGKDEKDIKEARNKTFETEVEVKAWKEELDYKELMNRRRTLGNIRFIGELFKLRMISEHIMHNQCIVKLLRADKQESLEDHLECLCKLLATVGKDLDHPKGKMRMDQYFQQMQKIMMKKKISSRIKFALQDVMELRLRNWVPRRDEGNPKTIDQIHEEAHRKEREQEMQRQNDKLMRKSDNRRGGGGRDSPSVRGGGGGDNMPAVSADGWQSVGAKSTRQIAAAPVDPNRFKLQKKNDGEISLGPARPGVWSRGASGGSSRSGSNTPTSEVEQRSNRYDVLTDSNVSHSSFDNKGRSSGGRQGIGSSRRETSSFGQSKNERSAALRAVKDITGGRNSRNQSPAREMRNSPRNTPPSVTPTPPVVDAAPPQVSESKMEKSTKSTIEEYISCNDKSEALLCLEELKSPSMHYVFVRAAMALIIEKKPKHREMVGDLFRYFIKGDVITLDQMNKGLKEIFAVATDIAVDVPLIYKYLGEVLGNIIYDGTLPLINLKDAIEPLITANYAGKVIEETLKTAVQRAENKEAIAALWQASKISWEMLVPNASEAQELSKKMDFLSALIRSNHASEVQEELTRLLKEKSERVTNNVISYVEDKVPSDRQSKLEFIHMLTRLVCNSSVVEDKDGCRCDRKLLASRKNILERFINAKKELELQALYALQQVVSDKGHPKDLLKNLFEELYESEVISEDTFYCWEESKDFPEGKGSAVSSVKGFLEWLRKAEEESNEEETLSSARTNSAQQQT